MPLTLTASSLAHLFDCIVSRSTKKQVVQLNAIAHIAMVTNLHPVWNRPIGSTPDNTMRAFHRIFWPPDLTITRAKHGLPQQASCCRIVPATPHYSLQTNVDSSHYYGLPYSVTAPPAAKLLVVKYKRRPVSVVAICIAPLPTTAYQAVVLSVRYSV